jgi:hypothetical protein
MQRHASRNAGMRALHQPRAPVGVLLQSNAAMSGVHVRACTPMYACVRRECDMTCMHVCVVT